MCCTACMASSSLERVGHVLCLRFLWKLLSFVSYNAWICTRCRKTCANESHAEKNADDTFDWLYNGNNIRTPTTAGFSLGSLDHEYVPVSNDVTPCQETNKKQDFTKWLASSGYDGRWRSTDDYTSLSRHDKTTFRTQLKAIFRHVLIHLAPNDAEVVWEDFIDDENRKPARTKDG